MQVSAISKIDPSQELAKQLVIDYYRRVYQVDLTMDKVFIVWYSKTLKNWKALVGSYQNDNLYFEITHNGELNHTYVDVYDKVENYTIPND